MKHRTSTAVLRGLVIGAVVLFGTLASAQAPDAAADKQARTAVIKESLAQNKAALRQYSWIETTQVSMKGEVKKEEQKQCYYGADGKVEKTPLAGAEPQKQQQQAQGG